MQLHFMETLAFPLILIVGGLYFGVRNIRFLRNENALREYMRTSPKAVLWVKKYGMEGAVKLARETFMPIGIVVSGVMVGVGGWTLWRTIGF
jgi:hypothetical protein